MNIYNKKKIMEIRKNIVINAPPEVVFKAITDPQELTLWFPDQVVLEPRVGGKMKFSFYKNSKRGNQDCGKQKNYFHEGTIREFIPNKKTSYTWKDSYGPDFPTTFALRITKQV